MNINQPPSITFALGADTIAGLLKRPEYALALGTLWLYLVACSYLDGYMQLYLVGAHWFSPSVFTLIAFSSTGILYALVAASVYMLLYHLAGERGFAWYIVFLVFFSAIVWLSMRYFFAAWDEYGWVRSDLIWGPSFVIASWGFAPLWHHLYICRLQKRIVIPTESRFMGKISIKIIDAAFAAWLAWTFAIAMNYEGFVRAKNEYDRAIAAWRAVEMMKSPGVAVFSEFDRRMLFTDGNATLQLEASGNLLIANYKSNPDAGPVRLVPIGQFYKQAMKSDNSPTLTEGDGSEATQKSGPAPPDA